MFIASSVPGRADLAQRNPSHYYSDVGLIFKFTNSNMRLGLRGLGLLSLHQVYNLKPAGKLESYQ